MSDEKKAFFRERDSREIRKMHSKQVFRPRSLVKRILDLAPSEDALELRFQLTPGRFFRGGLTGKEASRKCFKHGDLIASSQPRSQQEAYQCREIPLAIRERDFSQLQEMKEED